MKMDTQPLSCCIVQLDNPTEDQKPEAGIFLLIFFLLFIIFKNLYKVLNHSFIQFYV